MTSQSYCVVLLHHRMQIYLCSRYGMQMKTLRLTYHVKIKNYIYGMSGRKRFSLREEILNKYFGYWLIDNLLYQNSPKKLTTSAMGFQFTFIQEVAYI